MLVWSPCPHCIPRQGVEWLGNASKILDESLVKIDKTQEFIKEFQDFLNEAIERLLNKPVRKQSCWKDKPEPHMEQGKHKEVLHMEVEMFPPMNVSGDSDNE